MIVIAAMVLAVVAVIAQARVARARIAASKDGYRDLLEQLTDQQYLQTKEIQEMRKRIESMETMMREIE